MPEPPKRPLVLSIHGIRTRGTWQRDINRCLENADFDHALIDYGYFSLFRFLWPWSRDKQVRRFLEKYTAETRNGEVPSVIAHSLGTYIVANAMERYEEVQFDRIIFCGSIVPPGYDWAARINSGQVRYVLNDCGKRDIWVRIAEWVVADAGPSGVSGFTNLADGKVIERFHPFFRHSDFFYERNVTKQWIPFLLGEEIKPVTPADKRPFNWKFTVVFLALILALLIAAYFLYGWWRCADSPSDPIPGPLSIPNVTKADLPDALDQPRVPPSDVNVTFYNHSGHNLAVIMYACDHFPDFHGDPSVGWKSHQFYLFNEGEPERLEGLPHEHGVYVLFVKGKCDSEPISLGYWNLAEGKFPIVTIRSASAHPHYAIELTFDRE